MSAPQTRRVTHTKNNQLLDVMELPNDPVALRDELRKRFIWDPPIKGEVPNSVPPVSFYRVPILVRNTDGTEGDLIIGLDRCLSFGTSENKSPETQKLTGYGTSIVMYDLEGATAKQARSVLVIETIADIVAEHMMLDEVKGSMDMWTLKLDNMENPKSRGPLNPMYYKKEKGKIIAGSSPTLYPKLDFRQAKVKNGRAMPDRMVSRYYSDSEVDSEGNPEVVDPLTLIGVRHYVEAAVKIESVFMGSKSKNLQVKIYECFVHPAESNVKRLLHAPTPRIPNSSSSSSNPAVLIPAIATSAPAPVVPSSSKDEIKASVAQPTSAPSKPEQKSDDSDLTVSDDEGEPEEPMKPPTPPPEPKKIRKVKNKVPTISK